MLFELKNFFLGKSEIICYNSDTQIILKFKEIRAEYPFLFCKDEKHQYIINGETGEIIYKKEYTAYSESYFCYCGNTDNGFAFFDAKYSTYLYPEKTGYKCHDKIFISPVVINKRNVANITEDEAGIGVIDAYGNNIFENLYDSVAMELKITVLNGNIKTEKTIPVLQHTTENRDTSKQ